MELQIRKLAKEEIDDIPSLDVSSTDPVYNVAPDGSLTRREGETCEHPRWGEKETATRLNLWHRNIDEGATFLGAFDGCVFMGFCLLSAEAVDDAPEVYSIFVDRAHRGKGVGSALLSAAEQLCRERGAAGMRVTTGPDRGGAIQFYSNKGFEVIDARGATERDQRGWVKFLKRFGTTTT